MEKRTLLIADDDEMSRTIIKKFLKNYFEVLEAEDGAVACDIIESTHVDSMLLDIVMPNMDGIEVLKRIRANDKYNNIGILVATSVKEKAERRVLSLGADDVVSKPYDDPIVIEKRLHNILAAKYSTEGTNASAHDTFNAKEMENICKRLHSIAEIVDKNMDNEHLVREMMVDIHREADKLAQTYLK